MQNVSEIVFISVAYTQDGFHPFRRPSTLYFQASTTKFICLPKKPENLFIFAEDPYELGVNHRSASFLLAFWLSCSYRY